MDVTAFDVAMQVPHMQFLVYVWYSLNELYKLYKKEVNILIIPKIVYHTLSSTLLLHKVLTFNNSILFHLVLLSIDQHAG